MNSDSVPESVPPLEGMPGYPPPPPSREVQDEEQQVNRLLAARVNYLKRQEAFLGTDPMSEEDNTQEFVKRLVRYSAAQSEVINAQNMILASIGII